MQGLRMRLRAAGENTTALIFLSGMLAGFLITNMGKGILLTDKGLFDEETLYRMKYMTVDSSALFCYILRKRLCCLLFLAVAATTYLGRVVYRGAIFWYGLSAGAFLTALMLRYGVKGILLTLVGIFPQYLLYVPAFLLFLRWAEHLYHCIYARGAGFDAGEKGFARIKAAQLLLIVGLVCLGCLLEGYVNPYLLLGYLKIF